MGLAARTWADGEGAARTVLTPDEARILAIPRGTLTDQERRDIEKHVVHTTTSSSRFRGRRSCAACPRSPGSHHEKLNGRGYPKAADAAHIPVQSRMMTIADIYDALTASDRPYKKALPMEEALAILDAERRAGAIDAALLELFIEGRVFESAEQQPLGYSEYVKAGANA
jgi:HD-GYP domain-containing protein (c-di-GMP phosphodiesterase class II)